MNLREESGGNHANASFNLPLIAVLQTCVLACFLLCTLTRSEWVNTVGAVPLALLLPGSLLVLAVDPASRFVRGIERWLWSIGSSIGITVVGGFALNKLGGIYQYSFLAYLTGVGMLAGLVALARHWRASRPDMRRVSGDYSLPSLQNIHRGLALGRAIDGDIEAGWDTTDIGQPALALAGEPRVGTTDHRNASGSWYSVALVLLSVAIFAAALGLSEWSQSTTLREHFVQFWLVPESKGGSPTGGLQIGIQNYEGIRESYLVEAVTNTGRQVGAWHVHLAANAEWTRTIIVTSGTSVSATLAAASDPSRVLRSVHVGVS